MMQASPTEQHQWLHQLLGEWTVETVMDMGEGEGEQTATGTETVRSLGGLWVLAEGTGEITDGQTGNWLMTIGYDVAGRCFVGSWVGSMMTNMFVYEGRLDSAGKVLTLETLGPDMKGEGSETRYQDVIEIETPDLRTMTSRIEGDEGGWVEIMKATFRRTS